MEPGLSSSMDLLATIRPTASTFKIAQSVDDVEMTQRIYTAGNLEWGSG
jgi:hypothetical protein